MRNIIVMLGLLGGFIYLSSIDANAVACIGYNRMTGALRHRSRPHCGRHEQHWCRSPRARLRYRC